MKCHHPAADHRRYDWIWEENANSVDAKEKYDSACREITNSENALHEVERAIRNLEAQIEALEPEIGMLCTSYQAQCLSGSLSGQISKSVQFFTLHLETLQFEGADPRRIKMVEDIVEKMRRKQKLVNDAINAAQNHNPSVAGPIDDVTAGPSQVTVSVVLSCQ
jgi:predicted RNase H-like nuclease (RuvC/YqgF family)